jgi:hypothetical protein
MLKKGWTSKAVAALVGAALLVVAVSACGVAEDGPHTVRSRQVAPFRRIEVHGSTEVVVRPGRPGALRLEGGINRVEDLRTRVEGGTLVVEKEGSSGTIDIGDDPARVVATAPGVESVRIDGSGTVELRGLRGAELATAIYGSGEVRADGQVRSLRSRVDGSGSLDLASLRADEATVAISGSGSADLGATDRLVAAIDGSGAVTYGGDPAVSERISGSGRIQPR